MPSVVATYYSVLGVVLARERGFTRLRSFVFEARDDAVRLRDGLLVDERSRTGRSG